MKYKYLQLAFACLFIIIFISTTAFAQSVQDYVITQKKDTIKCTIKKPFFGGYDKYRITEKDKFIAIKPEEIKEYGIKRDSVILEAVLLPNGDRAEFVHRLESGKIKLYQKFVSNGKTTQTTWYACKDNGILYEIKTNGIVSPSGVSRSDRKKAVVDLLSDNAAIAKYYAEKNDFGFDAIRDAIQKYNASVGTK